MKKLHLYLEEELQGKFSPKKLNLLLLFQVNCPGCFIYGIPTFNNLHEMYRDKIGFLGLSTAFEDFDLNTRYNTQALVHNSELIGETKKAFLQQDIGRLPYRLNFPVAMDASLQLIKKRELVEIICKGNPNFPIWPDFDQDFFRTKVADYIDTQESSGLTFVANQFKGTPTLVLFNEKYDLLQSWFGHEQIEVIIDKIEAFI